jgi:hypothetical protein
MQRRSIQHDVPLDQRLVEEAQRLRKEARGTPPGITREKLIETASHIYEWLGSPGLQAPR